MSKKETISLKDLGVADTIPAPVKEEKPKEEVAKVEVKAEAKAPVVEEVKQEHRKLPKREAQVIGDVTEIAERPKEEAPGQQFQDELMGRLDNAIERNKDDMMKTTIQPVKDMIAAQKMAEEISDEGEKDEVNAALEATTSNDTDTILSLGGFHEEAVAVAGNDVKKDIGEVTSVDISNIGVDEEEANKILEEAKEAEDIDDDPSALTKEEEEEFKKWAEVRDSKLQERIKTLLYPAPKPKQLRISSAAISATKAFSANAVTTNSASVPLIDSGRTITMSSLIGEEIPMLDASQYDTPLEASRNAFSILWKHDVSANKPDFTKWLQSICDWDVYQLYWCAYKATFGKSNYITYSCPDCGGTMIELKKIEDMIRLSTNVTKTAKERLDAIMKGEKVESLLEPKLKQISSEYAITLKAPSIYDTIFAPSALETSFRRKYSNILGMAQYIENVFRVNSDGLCMPIQTEVRDNVTKSIKLKTVVISKMLDSLTTDEAAVLTTVITSLAQHSRDEFEYLYPEANCDGVYGPAKDKNGKRIDGTKCTHHFEERSTIWNASISNYQKITPLDMLFSRHQLPLIANFTIA